MNDDDDQPSLFDEPNGDKPKRRRDPDEHRPGLARRDGNESMKRAAGRVGPGVDTQRGQALILMHETEDGLTALDAEIELLKMFPRMRNVRARITELHVPDEWLVWRHLETGEFGQWEKDERVMRVTATGEEAEINYFNPDAEDDYVHWLKTRSKDAQGQDR